VPLVGQVYRTERATLIQGDCLEVLRSLPDASVDAVIADPPYPEISRPYGRMAEAEWFVMMHGLIPEVRRVLKPTGSAVFVLQPNSRKVGSLRSFLWEFMAWVCREWNVIQDVYWWNTCSLPVGGAITGGLLRASVKVCVWCGPSDCYRKQEAVLIPEAEHLEVLRRAERNRGATRFTGPGGHSVKLSSMRSAASRRGGVTPFNLLPIGTQNRSNGGLGHPASTPLNLCSWWVRYICPPGGTVLDPFSGSGTVGVAAIKEDRNYIGIETVPAYCSIAKERIAKAEGVRACR
jgi:DNA modification methylase